MQLLEDVYNNYHATLADGSRVGASNVTLDEIAIREGLPPHFRHVIASLGRDPDRYRIYGGLGQINFNRAKIPWVAICDREITTTTNEGYYIVLLFKQNMDGCYLSLNQGYTQFKRTYAAAAAARRHVARSAYACAEYLDPPASMISGPIALGATHDMGQGYERGAIVSISYPRGSDVGSMLGADLDALLNLHDRLKRRVGKEILSFLPPASEADFQTAAMETAQSSALPTPPAGPLKPPPPLSGGRTGRFRRDYNMAAIALRNAQFQCEIDPTHISFTSNRTKKSFVEAHHLVPVSRQSAFAVRLDVPENIVALCPNCHRLLHHGVAAEKRRALAKLIMQRSEALATRGIAIGLPQALAIYGDDLTEDD